MKDQAIIRPWAFVLPLLLLMPPQMGLAQSQSAEAHITVGSISPCATDGDVMNGAQYTAWLNSNSQNLFQEDFSGFGLIDQNSLSVGQTMLGITGTNRLFTMTIKEIPDIDLETYADQQTSSFINMVVLWIQARVDTDLGSWEFEAAAVTTADPNDLINPYGITFVFPIATPCTNVIDVNNDDPVRTNRSLISVGRSSTTLLASSAAADCKKEYKKAVDKAKKAYKKCLVKWGFIEVSVGALLGCVGGPGGAILGGTAGACLAASHCAENFTDDLNDARTAYYDCIFAGS